MIKTKIKPLYIESQCTVKRTTKYKKNAKICELEITVNPNLLTTEALMTFI